MCPTLYGLCHFNYSDSYLSIIQTYPGWISISCCNFKMSITVPFEFIERLLM